MYSLYKNNPIIKKLTSEEIEAVYRYQQMEYRKEDVKNHATDLYYLGDITEEEKELVINNNEILAEKYIYKYHDCNCAENDIMEMVIMDYINDIRCKEKYGEE